MSTVKRTLATVGLTAVETAVVKATFDDDECPKNKHIRTICDYVELELAGTGYDTTLSNKNLTLVEMFRKRVNKMSNSSLSWKVVIKSLITIHILLRQCDVAFVEELSHYGSHRVFELTNRYNDNTNANCIVHSTFIRKYSRYLLQKLIVHKEIDFNVERKLGQHNKEFFKEFDINTLGKILPKIMKQLHAVVEVIPQINTTSFIVHPLDKAAMLLLIKDSLRIYSAIQLILWQLIQSFQKFNLEQSKWISNTYNSYFDLNLLYQNWFQKVVKLGIINHQFAPKFNTLPESLAQKLRQYITQQENAKKKKKKTKAKKKNVKKPETHTETHTETNTETHTKEQTETETETETKESDLLGFHDLFDIQQQPQNTNVDEFEWIDTGFDDWWNAATVTAPATATATATATITATNNNNNNNNNNYATAISGGTARILKKKNVATSNDPFIDLLNFN